MKKILAALSLTILVYSVQAVVPGPVAFYTFDGNALDQTGRGHNGTVQGATLTTDRFGNPNSAYAFNGSSIIDVPSSTDFDYNPAIGMTYSLWAYLPQYVNPEHLLGRRDGVNPFWQLAIGPGAMNTSDVPLNSWVQIALTLESSVQRYYVNGTLVLTTLNSVPNPVTGNIDVYIGGSGPYQPFVGSLDNVRIYDHVLTSTEIQQLYLSEVPEPGAAAFVSLAAGVALFCRRQSKVASRV